MSERYQLHPAVFIFLEREGSVLFFRRLHGWHKGLFDIPAGHVEEGETFRETACRELTEETGVTVHPEDLELIHAMEYPSRGYLYVFFRAIKWEGEPRIVETEKHKDLSWFVPSEQTDIAAYSVAAWERARAGERWSIWRDDNDL